MSDTLKIGQIIETEQHRDAIHIAVAPVTAGRTLLPGLHVGFATEGDTETVTDAAEKLIGICDPFLSRKIEKGERFWMLLYPGSITSLRHDWTHPSFAKEAVAPKANNESEEWLKWYADEVGLSYQAVMDAADAYVTSGRYHTFGYGTPEVVYEKREEFWKHYQIATGKTVEETDATFFSCSC
jgi:hypothetical protein